MNQSSATIGTFSAFSAIILAVGLMNHVLVIPPLLEVTQRDAWLTTVLAALPFLLWTCLIYYIMNRTGQQPLLSWLHRHYGAAAAWIVRIYYIVYLFMIAAITLKDTTTWTKVSYLSRTPIFVLALSLLIVCCFSARWGLKTIMIASGILLPFVIVLGDFVMSANLPKKNYSLLLPILENGWEPIGKGGIYIGGGLAELSILLIFQHSLKSRLKLWWLWVLALFLIILIWGPITGAIAEFGPFEAMDLRYPAYEEWRLVSIGKYIQHVDFLSIYQWLSGAVIRIAVAICLIVDLLPQKSQKIRARQLHLVCALLLLTAILPISDMMYLDFMKRIYFPWSLFSALALTLILAVLIRLKKDQPSTAHGGGNS